MYVKVSQLFVRKEGGKSVSIFVQPLGCTKKIFEYAISSLIGNKYMSSVQFSCNFDL